jgi:hypothetical protein
MKAMRSWVALAVALVGLASPGSAGGATTVGQTFDPNSGQFGFTHLQPGSPGAHYAAPFAGVITSWSHEAHPSQLSVPTDLKFKVARPLGDNSFLIVAEEGPVTPIAGALNTYSARIPVQAGDVIGFYQPTSGATARSQSGYATQSISGDPPAGSTATFGAPQTPRQLNVSASLEPDTDCDELGDDSQDGFVDPYGCDDAAPGTTITKGPKDKTRKKTATFEFTGADIRAVAGFQCRLDGEAFRACSSPTTYKVKKGKHSFAVQAIDQAGNVSAPATDTWKRKKRRK